MSKNSQKDTRYIRKKMDTSLLVAVIFLICFGLVMIYSTSSYQASYDYGDSTVFLRKQIISTGIGLIAMFLCAVTDYHFWMKFAPVAYIATVVCIIAVLSPLGIESHGARRWIGVGSFSFQPAEMAKLTMILVMAVLLSKVPNMVNKLGASLVTFGLMGTIVLMILGITDNLSSAIIVAAISYVMIMIVSRNTKWYVMLVVVMGVIGGAVLMFAGGFRAQRIMVWLDPITYAKDGGYQVLQGLYALGSGGLFGKGLGQSVQKLGFVPESQNDMIFTIICEELGIFGGIALIILFGFLIWRCMVIASNAPDLYGSLIVIGVMSHIAIQVILNIAVVTNTIPNTGITLPFISYGGTSVLFLMAEMGLVLSVSKAKVVQKRKVSQEEED